MQSSEMEEVTNHLSISAPGRICLFGEHQDYLNLPVIACAINLRINIIGKQREDHTILIDLPDINRKEEFSLEGEPGYGKERDYFKSSFNVLKRHGYTFSRGLECMVNGSIPINSGTSSSSALIVAWINLLARSSDQRASLAPDQIAEYAYEAEVAEFGEPGGMMDHYSTSIGGIIYLESFPRINVEKIKTELGYFVLGDSKEPKNTKFILARVKEQIKKIAKQLQAQYPDFSLQWADENDIDKYSNQLNSQQAELLKGTLKNRDITKNAKNLLNNSVTEHKAIGKLLNEHQAVLRDILQISTPKIDRMIEAASDAGAYGAKINGSGGGGCMFAYAPEEPEKVKEAIEKNGGTAYIIQVDSGTASDTEAN
jgi:galactokinase